MIPSSSADKIIHYDSRCYSGQFSDDGNFFFSCAQDFKVRMYDTSNPFEWKYYKTVDYPFGQWTITDASLSPDNKYLAYSSIRHKVGLAPTDPADHSDPMLLDFTNMKRDASQHGFHGSSHFGVGQRPSVTALNSCHLLLLTASRYGPSASPATAAKSWPAPPTAAS